MKPPKIRAECSACGKRSRPVGAYTAHAWMDRHITEHLAPTCEHEWRPLGLYGSLRCKTCGLDDHANSRLKENR